ncbi:hypothetical protein CI109_105457 [Kwoniella shandongensis]|uniref:Uncharacterized protein n=1 Tax=Kwoniella shandongensis TaxID=1734106 RepID=A0A5M6C2D1_9TREE|nr:uncharacterized protein CI109_002178 [Kwoniella shandongensis]KAA5529286.1 hypothetical protein CI109_002178 [Kwoniella shandongensis]
MHATALLALLPLLATTLAAPRRPMPFLHARAASVHTLDLPPALASTSTAAMAGATKMDFVSPSTITPTQTPTSGGTTLALSNVTPAQDQGQGQGIWAIDTIPLSLIDNVLSDVGVTTPTPTPTPTPMASPTQQEYQAADAVDGVLATTTVWMSNPTSFPTGSIIPPGDSLDLPSLTTSDTAWEEVTASEGEWSIPTSTAGPSPSLTAFDTVLPTGGVTATATATATASSGSGAGGVSTTTVWWTPPPTASPTSAETTAQDGWQTIAAIPSPTSSTSSAVSTTEFRSVTSSASTSISTSTATATATAEALSTPSSSPGDNDSAVKEKKEKKIRYKHCADTLGTVTEITVLPCEGGKGTINDPCHFHAGNNYTITLTYVSPLNATQPRSNLSARDRTSSEGSERFPYPGQSFDGCKYTTCPIVAQESSTFTYEFVTVNERFDQLTFNMTDGLEGESLMCAFFPVTFMPSVTGRSLLPRLPFAGLRRGF